MLLIECPNCKKRVSEKTKECRTATGSGCGTPLPPRQRIYWVQYRADGKSKTKKIGPSRSAAVNYEWKVKVEIAENKYIDKKTTPEITIKKFIKDVYRPWCKINNRGYSNKRFFIDEILSVWGSKKLADLNYRDVAQHQQSLAEQGMKVKFNRLLATLKHMYSLAQKTGHINGSPLGSVNDLRFEEQGRVRFLDPKELQSLIMHCSPRLKSAVTVAVNTGGRRNEVLGLKVKDVDLERELVSFWSTKSGEPRHVPMNETLKSEVQTLLEGKEADEYLFSNGNGHHVKDVKKSFKTALSKAGIEDFTFHDLRHTFASNLVMKGVDLYVVKELLGHSTIRMTEKYAHLAPDHKTRAVNVLDGLFEE